MRIDPVPHSHLVIPTIRSRMLLLLAIAAIDRAAVPSPAFADCPAYVTSYPSGRAPAFYKPAYPDRAKDFAVVLAGGFYHVYYTRVDRTLPAGSLDS